MYVFFQNHSLDVSEIKHEKQKFAYVNNNNYNETTNSFDVINLVRRKEKKDEKIDQNQYIYIYTYVRESKRIR